MALNFGEILGGIGAAMGGTAPQYVQNLKAGKQADMAAREKALYEDAAIGLQLVESGNLQGFYDLATDRMEQLRRFPDAVPNDTVRLMALAKLGMGGERAAIGQLHAELIAATKAGQVKGYLQAPEPVRGVEVAGELRNPFSGEVMGPRAAPPVSLTSRQREAQDMASRAGPVGSAEYNKTYGDYMNRATGTTFHMGQIPTPPTGYRNVFDEQGRLVSQEAIPGGPAQQAQQTRGEQASTYADIVVEDIGRYTDLIKNQGLLTPVTGITGRMAQTVAGTPAADAAALEQTIGANVQFDRLQAMRESSPTGGALGNVTERELSDLRSTLGQIGRSQSDDQLLFNLERLRQQYGAVMDKFSAYPAASGTQPGAAQADSSNDPLGIRKK